MIMVSCLLLLLEASLYAIAYDAEVLEWPQVEVRVLSVEPAASDSSMIETSVVVEVLNGSREAALAEGTRLAFSVPGGTLVPPQNDVVFEILNAKRSEVSYISMKTRHPKQPAVNERHFHRRRERNTASTRRDLRLFGGR